MSNNSVRDIAQDKYGCLWIATDEGLNRVCGSRTQKYYKVSDGEGLSGNELNCLLDDPEHSIMWIGTQRAGLIALNYDTGKYTVFTKDDDNAEGIITNEITSMAFDRKGNLWMSTYWKGIDCLDIDTGKFTHYNSNTVNGLECDRVWSIALDDKKDKIYVAHERGGFSIIDIGTRSARNYTVRDGLLSDEVHCIYIDNNNIWLGTNKGLSIFNTDTKTFENFNLDDFGRNCTDIEAVNGEMWITMDHKGVVAFDRNSGKFRQVMPRYIAGSGEKPEFLYKSEPTRIFKDFSGNILIGTLRDGLAGFSLNTDYFFIDNQLQHSGKDVSSANILSVVALGSSVWYGTSDRGILSGNEITQESNTRFPSHIMAMASDDNGMIWFCDPDGFLTKFNPRTGEMDKYDLGIEGDHNRSLFIDGDNLWIGSYGGITLFNRNEEKVTRHFDALHNFIRPIRKDGRGNLLVGTFGDGLVVFDKSMIIIYNLNVDNGFTSNTINDIYVDGDNIWIATSEGLVKFKNNDYSTFQLIAQPSRSVNSVIKDKDDNIWYSTGIGIGVIRKDGSQAFFDEELPVVGFNNGSVAVDESGRLYFGTHSGALTFNPEYVLDCKRIPVPVISDLIVNGRKKEEDVRINTNTGSEVELSYAQNSFTIFVNSPDFFFHNHALEYRMKGLDDNWNILKGESEVTYRELPYGRYEFQVRNVADASENRDIVSLKIHIMPPLWLRWWAKLTYIVVLLLVIAFFVWKYSVRIRKNSMTELEENKKEHRRELDEERLKFFTNVTHELRTPLTLIMGPLEDISQSNSLNDEDRWKITLIHKNAKRLLGLVNQLLDFRKTETQNKRLCVSKGNIVSDIKEMVMKYQELNRNPDISISVTSTVDDIHMYFDKEVITMILDNLISNALKYTKSGFVSVSVTTERIENKCFVRINVKDTGYGISRDALPYIFDRYFQEKSTHQASGTGIGLALVKALVELHKGEIKVESAKDVGTNFSVFLDRDYDYPEALHAENEQDECAGEKTNLEYDESLSMSRHVKDDNIVVLIVEDNSDILEYIEQSFCDIFDVKTASNGSEGIEIARSVIPDVIVTDIMMPVMDGIEMCRMLKNDVSTSHIPIIMLTAKDSSFDKETGYKLGVDSYLTKPFNSSLLLARINNIISHRHMISEYYKTLSHIVKKDNLSNNIKVEEKLRFHESMNRIDREFMDKLDNIVRNNLSSGQVNVDYLTDKMFMSRATLYRKIKALTGMSSNEYIRNVRMQMAKELLISGDMSVAEVSDAVGCSSPAYFREAFKIVYGVSPSEYLRNLKDDTVDLEKK